jgi:hypothetical protein
MSDLVVTVPKWFWKEWIAEGDAVGDPPTGTEWGFFMGGARPDIEPGDRLYIVAHALLRGYAPVTRLMRLKDERWCICREAGAVAVTIENPVPGFRGWRRRWWQREQEKLFIDWKTKGVP